jgi:hypothetical protein
MKSDNQNSAENNNKGKSEWYDQENCWKHKQYNLYGHLCVYYDTDSDNKQCSDNASLKHLSDHDHVNKQYPGNASLKHPTDQDRATNKESLCNEKIKQEKTGHQDLARLFDIVCFCLFSSLYLFVVVGFFISGGILVDQ